MCDRLIVHLSTDKGETYPIRPQTVGRACLGPDVPKDYADEYHAACRVLFFSRQAAGAISRRLLHLVLAVKAGAGKGGLTEQIQAALESDMPQYLKQALQTLVRVAKLEPGSLKSNKPDTLCPVEVGEPEWTLDVLQSMFEFYFVQPAKMQRRQARLEETIAPTATVTVTDTSSSV